MRKGDKGKKVLGVIVILAIIVSVFSGVVSAEDVSEGLKQNVADAEIQTEVGNLSSEELTKAFGAVTDDTVNIEFADQSAEFGVLSSRSSYGRQLAYNYAMQWWNSCNHECGDYKSCTPWSYWGWECCGYSSHGGDCANFVSQCLIAGGHPYLTGEPDCKYPDGTLCCRGNCGKAEVGAKRLGDCLVAKGWERTCGYHASPPSNIDVGDVLIYHAGSCDDWSAHATIVTYVSGSDVRITCHSENRKNEPYTYLSTLRPYYEWLHYPESVVQPTVETRDASSIMTTAAFINGRILDDGGSTIIERRFDWGTTPTCEDDWTADVTVVGNNFFYFLTGLTPCTTYYFRAWAKNSAGWGWGNVLSFTTSAECPTPGTPSNPSPSNHATDVSINTDLDWSDCSNTDFYDVYFGTSSPPPYYGSAPTSSYPFQNDLDYNTKYYWKIVAKSNCGGITQGPIWDFTTGEEPNQPPNTPSIPSGPSSGYTGTSYSYSTSATDPDGDQVKYAFDWGDGTTSETGFVNSGTSASKSHSWSSGGTYYVKAKATDSKGASSGWSGSKTVTITTPNNPPNTPSIPSGPSSGYTGTSYSYSTSATDPDGDQVKYTFDWEDGTTSETGFVNSGTSASKSHSWSSGGTYYVKAKATDSKGASSGWSGSKTVTITTPNNPPNTPSIPSGPTSGQIGISYPYSTVTTDPNSDNVYYWFDWGDDTNSGWIGPYPSGTSGSTSKEWINPGTYNVKTKAKDEHGAESSPLWSDPLPVCINGLWENDPINPCKKRRLSCTGEYEYQNKPDGTICGCTASNTLKSCYSGVCSTDTGICDSANCGADAACDGKRPGDSCGGGRKCDSNCKCGATGSYGGGIYRNGLWALRTEDSPYAKVYRFGWGRAIDIPVTGDWNEDGTDTIGLYRDGEWILSNSIDTPSRDHTSWWGRATDIPVTGDWNNDGTDTIGLYRDGEWILSNSIDTPSRDHTSWWGRATDIPVTGDWNNDGTDTIGLYRDGEWILSNSIDTPSRDHTSWWGRATDIPVTGDWNNDGTDTIGLYRDGEWILSNSITNPSRDHTAWWGLATDIPVTGDWI